MSTSNPPKPAHLPPIKLYNKIIKYYLPLSLSLSLSLSHFCPTSLSLSQQPHNPITTTPPPCPPCHHCPPKSNRNQKPKSIKHTQQTH